MRQGFLLLLAPQMVPSGRQPHGAALEPVARVRVLLVAMAAEVHAAARPRGTWKPGQERMLVFAACGLGCVLVREDRANLLEGRDVAI
eukprot:858214-Pyramimonas_sp.AAC.1